jgi:hypothetical protein
MNIVLTRQKRRGKWRVLIDWSKVITIHKEVRTKIAFLQRQDPAFRWSTELYHVQRAMNQTPKMRVQGHQTPSQVHFGDEDCRKQADDATKKAADIMLRHLLSESASRGGIQMGERVLVRLKRHTCLGRSSVHKAVVLQRRGQHYKVALPGPQSQWVPVSALTSRT